MTICDSGICDDSVSVCLAVCLFVGYKLVLYQKRLKIGSRKQYHRDSIVLSQKSHWNSYGVTQWRHQDWVKYMWLWGRQKSRFYRSGSLRLGCRWKFRCLQYWRITFKAHPHRRDRTELVVRNSQRVQHEFSSVAAMRMRLKVSRQCYM